MLMWRCGNGLGTALGWCFNTPALLPTLLLLPGSRASSQSANATATPGETSLHEGEMQVTNSSPKKYPKMPILSCGHWPSSYKWHFWFPSLACGWAWVVWEGISAHFAEQGGQSQHCILSIALPGAEGGSWKCSSPGIPCWKEEAGPAWAVPAGRGEIRGQGLHRAGAEPEGAEGNLLPV